MFSTDMFMPVTGFPLLVYGAVGIIVVVSGAVLNAVSRVRRKR